jgi:putative nucleotidyltransferase with HDIG domain
MSIGTIDSKVQRVISNIRNLPTPPIVFHQIQKVISDPNVSAAKVSSILAEDPAMSVKVLRLTNSAFYGLNREIESVKQAVVIIGFEAIKNLVLSASVLDMFKGKTIDQEYQEKYWRHSLSTAFCCRLLANRLKARGFVDPDAAFSAGLLHDVGKMVVSCFLPDEYEQFLEARNDNIDSMDHQIEENIFGYTHAQIGGFLGTQWKIPHKLTEAITFHHQPQLYEEDDPMAYIVYLANWIAKKTFYPATDSYLVGELDVNVLKYMDVDPDKLDMYGDLLREEYAKSETFMQLVGIKT